MISSHNVHDHHVQALDDPIAPEEAIPYEALRGNPNTVLVTTMTGGHLGWCAGAEWNQLARSIVAACLPSH